MAKLTCLVLVFVSSSEARATNEIPIKQGGHVRAARLAPCASTNDGWLRSRCAFACKRVSKCTINEAAGEPPCRTGSGALPPARQCHYFDLGNAANSLLSGIIPDRALTPCNSNPAVQPGRVGHPA
ncbi:unnamed protein product [Symbiodinium natans]|uniref:Uncharacterized protein n=1 Tax=Symbiodinium natans TaxID=878477 RepID=A0A812T370_9DINO|nr:unnamed protein product [Symbiodinium natans]